MARAAAIEAVDPREAAFGAIPVPGRSRGRFLERNCSVGRTVNLIGDGWTFLILREAFLGVRRFDDFQRVLGVPRATLIQRLRQMQEQALLRRVQYSLRPPRFEYRLTHRGFELYPVMVTLMQFGDHWLREGPAPVSLVHRRCGHGCEPLVSCGACGDPLAPRRVRYRNGPGAGLSSALRSFNTRRSMDAAEVEKRRPSSLARAMDVIGDRWSFMVMREAWFGARRFEQFSDHLGISPGILADRLGRLVDLGVFVRVPHRRLAGRHEYAMTPLGDGLYGPYLAMLRWGDRWLATQGPPLILTHLGCGADFEPAVLCDHCRQPIRADEMDYHLAYTAPAGIPESPHRLHGPRPDRRRG